MKFKSGLKLGGVIGQGHFGDVHEGHDPLHRRVAVKVLRQTEDESSEEWNARKEDLMNEAQTLKAAEHKNVVRVLNICRNEEDDRLHMVTEFCDGGSLLKEYEAGPISLSRVRSITTDVCLGLDAIHARGMIHRDIKPGNILRSDRTWKIGDFGLVSDEIVNGYASAKGYADHVAPEVWKERATSVRSDVWAMGMTIYRLLHGHSFYCDHFREGHGSKVPSMVYSGGFAQQLPWLHHIPKPWRKFIRKAMHDDTEQRYQSAFALSQALADLPVEPDWECRYTTVTTTWTRNKGGRQHEVIWTLQSARKHMWTASNRGGQRDRSLGGVDKPICRSQLDSELDAFFANAR